LLIVLLLLVLFLMLFSAMLNHLTIRLLMNTLSAKTTVMKKAMMLTTQIGAATILAGLLATSAQAAKKEAKDAAAQAPVDIQTVMVQRCASEATSAKITDAKSAQKVCSCTIGVQANNLKLGEFWAIQSMAMNNKDPRDLPALKRIQPQLDKCREGIKFNAPEQAAAPAPAAPDTK